MIKAKSQFKHRSIANNVQIIIPVPSDADSGRFKTTAGTVKYMPETNVMIWSIKSFPVCIPNHRSMISTTKVFSNRLRRVERNTSCVLIINYQA
jgi:hypothetical protein